MTKGTETREQHSRRAVGTCGASHADRVQVIGVLKVAFVQGRLSKDE